MTKRGQILSLDYVISLLLVLLALGLLINFFELQTVNAKETQLQTEIETLAEGAARLALTSPDIACKVESLDGLKEIGVLPNCIPTQNGRLTKANLALPAGFGCAITTNPPGLFTTNCETKPPGGVDYYSVTRKILVKNGTEVVTKNELENCIDGTACTFMDTNITIIIWRE